MVAQAFELWVNPEVDRRLQEDRLPVDFALHSVQIIFPSPLDDKGNYVRLNEEVRALAKVKMNRSIEQGELVYERDIDDIEIIELADPSEPNAGHLTMLRIAGKWFIGFDFRRDKRRAREHLARAQEFLRVARLSFRRNLIGPGFDCLHSAAELAAKAELLAFMGLWPARPRDLKDHGFIRGRYGRWTGLGNAPKRANSALKRLSELRGRARYVEGDIPMLDRGRYLRAVSALISHVSRQLLDASNSDNTKESDHQCLEQSE